MEENNNLAFKFWFYILLVIATFLASVYLFLIKDTASFPVNLEPQVGSYSNCLKTEASADCVLNLEVVESSPALEMGLSGRESLDENSGMLFVLNENTVQCFWMKDMKFSLDFVWLSSDKEIVAITKNVSPNTYPETYCQEKVGFVLEINANQSEKLQFSVGQRLIF